MNKICLITGVMASGKSTVAQLTAERLPRAVHLRGDIFRKMIVTGRIDMAEGAGPDAYEQLLLRYRLTADAALRYYGAGFDVIVQDNYYGGMLPHMLSLLSGARAEAVVLCPSAECVARREAQPGKVGYSGYSVQSLWESFMRDTPRIGFWIDSTDQTADETASVILSRVFGV